MLRFQKAPKKPYKNFGEFVYKITRSSKRTKPYPCLNCSGYGRVRDPDAYCDPVEGYKLAGTVSCQVCGKTGEGTEESYKKLYKGKLKEWRSSKDNISSSNLELLDLCKKLKKAKMTDRQLGLIGVCPTLMKKVIS